VGEVLGDALAGVPVGVFVGALVGAFVGVVVGASVGTLVGVLLGASVGVSVIASVVGASVGVVVGAPLMRDEEHLHALLKARQCAVLEQLLVRPPRLHLEERGDRQHVHWVALLEVRACGARSHERAVLQLATDGAPHHCRC